MPSTIRSYKYYTHVDLLGHLDNHKKKLIFEADFLPEEVAMNGLVLAREWNQAQKKTKKTTTSLPDRSDSSNSQFSKPIFHIIPRGHA